ncbi:MAG TPA: hypothetical protein V6D08_09670, partial [Candidatus Obscuribacterales bacterium]
MHPSRRTRRGATLALTVACAILLATIGIAYVLMSMVMGGAKEFRHAVDAGTLAAARKALSFPYVQLNLSSPNGGDGIWCQAAFEAVADPGGKINLYNVNRVMAQALLVEMNYGAMVNEGTAGANFGEGGPYSWPYSPTNGAREHARQIKKAAFLVSEALGEQLQHPENHFPDTFRQVASANSLRMLGLSTTITPLYPWKFAFANRYEASNVFLEENQLPADSPLQAADIPRTKLKVAGKMRNFITGYIFFFTNTNMMGDPIADSAYFVPLRPLLKPNLVDEAEFVASQVPPIPSGIGGGPNPYAQFVNKLVPNAWSAGGTVTERLSSQTLAFKAYATAEATDKGVAAAITRGFIRIHASPDGQSIRLSDYIDDPALSAIKSRILQRIWEIDPDIPASALNTILGQMSFSPGTTDGYIFKDSSGG